MRITIKTFLSLLAVALLFTGLTSCTEHALKAPKIEDMVGTYAPESLSDPRVHADTRLELRGDGTCRMTDFPYVNYASSESSTLSYFNQNATWKIMGLGGVRLVITMSGTEYEFNILNTSAPYRIAQPGESVEFDELILHKLP